MSGKGGYQAPTNPAPASGPGRLSQRTDGGPGQPVRQLGDAAYGEQATFRSDQQGAPMAAAGGAPPAGGVAPGLDLSRVTPLNAPSTRPGEPVTSGAAAGPGPGTEALGPDPGIEALRANLPALELMAGLPTASRAFRRFYAQARARL